MAAAKGSREPPRMLCWPHDSREMSHTTRMGLAWLLFLSFFGCSWSSRTRTSPRRSSCGSSSGICFSCDFWDVTTAASVADARVLAFLQGANKRKARPRRVRARPEKPDSLSRVCPGPLSRPRQNLRSLLEILSPYDSLELRRGQEIRVGKFRAISWNRDNISRILSNV